MDCNKFREHIDDFIDNDISNALKASMLAHSESCPECKKELEDMQKIIDCMNSLPAISVPDDFLAKLNERIDSENAMLKTQSHNKYKKIFNYRTYSALAACVLLFAIVKADIPNMLNKSNGTEQSIVSVIPENNTRNVIGNANDGIIADTASATEETSAPESTPASQSADTVATKPVEMKTVQKATQSAQQAVTEATITPVNPQSTTVAVNTPVQPTPQIVTAQAEDTITEAESKSEKTSAPTPSEIPAPASAFSLTDETTEEAEITEPKEQTARISGSHGGGGGGASSGGGSISSVSSVGGAGGGDSINSASAVAESVSYTVTIHCNNPDYVLALLSSIGYTAKSGYYSISSANSDKLFAILDSNNIKYTKSKKDTSSNTTDIYIVVK